MTPLIIIDMQPRFDAANNRYTIRRIRSLINKHKQQETPILVVEYKNWGPTHQDILNALRLYPYHTVTKNHDDGTIEVQDALTELGIYPPTLLHICGVNRCYCVHDTAVGLKQLNYRVRLFDSACCCTEWHQMGKHCWSRDSLRTNGVLVK